VTGYQGNTDDGQDDANGVGSAYAEARKEQGPALDRFG